MHLSATSRHSAAGAFTERAGDSCVTASAAGRAPRGHRSASITDPHPDAPIDEGAISRVSANRIMCTGGALQRLLREWHNRT
jgi:hypothetical protein